MDCIFAQYIRTANSARVDHSGLRGVVCWPATERLTMTAPCSRCGAHQPVGARRCGACGSALGDPAAARWRRALGAAALAVLISVTGAWAIYAIHREMPAVPPGFERVVRIDAEPGSGFMATPAPAPAPTPAAVAVAAAPVARSDERLAAIQQSMCGDQTLLARIVCNERVRLRYCRDRWNEHPDCAASAPPNPGN